MSVLRAALGFTPLLLCALSDTHFAGRPAWTLETSGLRVTVLRGGGHVAEIAVKSKEGVNPLWVQSRPTIDPMEFDPARDSARFGGGAAAKLMSGLAGHSLCFPYWGNPSPSEERAGMSFHGETGTVAWSKRGSGADWIEIAAELPESRTRFVRKLTVRDAAVWFDETASNESGWDRPVGWCEHVTLGAPFLERTVTTFAASATRGKPVDGNESSRDEWPHGRDGSHTIDLSGVRNANAGGEVNDYLVDPRREIGFFAAFNPKFSVVFGYVFRRSEFRWLNVWESFTPELFTRGMEFSTTPIHGTGRALLSSPKMWDTPTFEWLDAKGSIRKRYAAFAASVPKTFKGVGDVQVTGSRLRLIERNGGPGLEISLGQAF